MPRKFQIGDWVITKGNLTAPKMQVLKYVPKKDSILGSVDYDTYVECIWFKSDERRSEVFHQNKLIKIIDTGELLKTFFTNPKLGLT